MNNTEVKIGLQLKYAREAKRIAESLITSRQRPGQGLSIEHISPEQLLMLEPGFGYCRLGRNSFLVNMPLVDKVPNFEQIESVKKLSRKQWGAGTKQGKKKKGKSGAVGQDLDTGVVSDEAGAVEENKRASGVKYFFDGVDIQEMW